MDANEIIADVAKRYNVTPAKLRGRDLHKQLTHARREVFRRLRNERGLSYATIGRMMGSRDHKTVMAVMRRVDGGYAQDIISRVAAQHNVSVEALKIFRGIGFNEMRTSVYAQLREIRVSFLEIRRLMGNVDTDNAIRKQVVKFTEARTASP